VNRRAFLKAMGYAAPTIFVPKLITVHWKLLRPYIYHPRLWAYATLLDGYMAHTKYLLSAEAEHRARMNFLFDSRIAPPIIAPPAILK